jgi:hypothetical protein
VLRWVPYARHTRTGESPISERTGAMRTSQKSATAKFAEIVKGEVRSISVPRTRVNKAAASCIWATRVHQPLHQRGQEPPAHIYAQLRAGYTPFPLSMRKAAIRPRATALSQKQGVRNTSQRGIEGSNPSSSASRVAHLQHKRESKDMGRNSVPYLINRYTNAGR